MCEEDCESGRHNYARSNSPFGLDGVADLGPSGAFSKDGIQDFRGIADDPDASVVRAQWDKHGCGPFSSAMTRWDEVKRVASHCKASDLQQYV